MKSLLTAAFIALLLHGLLIFMSPTWVPKKSAPQPSREPLTFALSYREPRKAPSPPPPKVLVQKEAPAPVMPPLQKPKKTTRPDRPTKSPPRVIKAPRPQDLPEPKTYTPSPVPTESPAAPEPPPVRPGEGSEKKQAFPRAVFLKELPPDGYVLYPRPGTAWTRGSKAAPPLREAAPLYQKNPPPPYPPIARRRGYEGTVLITVLVEREGTVKDLRILRTSGYPVLDQAALEAVREWRFEPGRRGEEPVEMWVNVPVRFQLK